MQRREYIDQIWWLHLNPLRVLLADCFMWRGWTYLLQKNISKMLMLVCVPAVGTKLEWQTIHTQCRSLKQDCHKEFTSAARKLAMSTRKLKKKLKNKWELSGSQRETHDEATSVGQDYVLWVLLLDCASNYMWHKVSEYLRQAKTENHWCIIE